MVRVPWRSPILSRLCRLLYPQLATLGGGSNEVPLIAIERDFGDIVHGALLNADQLCGKTIQAASQSKPLEEIPTDFEHGMTHSFILALAANFNEQQPGKGRGLYLLRIGVC